MITWTRRLVLSAIVIALLLTGMGFFAGYFAAPSTTDAVANQRPPLIGIASLTNSSYVRAVREAGGIPVVLPNTDGSDQNVTQYLAVLDGLIMPGGADIPPSDYGQEAHETTVLLDEERYGFEKALIHAWIEKTDKPLLGICLGSQWINVAMGGTLIQDIPSAKDTNHSNTKHPVRLESDSRLAGILGEMEMEVNSYHHQSADQIGKGLRAVAHSPEGVVEATEITDPHRFLIGVQWHPEGMPDSEVQRRLLRAFVEASGQ